VADPGIDLGRVRPPPLDPLRVKTRGFLIKFNLLVQPVNLIASSEVKYEYTDNGNIEERFTAGYSVNDLSSNLGLIGDR